MKTDYPTADLHNLFSRMTKDCSFLQHLLALDDKHERAEAVVVYCKEKGVTLSSGDVFEFISKIRQTRLQRLSNYNV